MLHSINHKFLWFICFSFLPWSILCMSIWGLIYLLLNNIHMIILVARCLCSWNLLYLLSIQRSIFALHALRPLICCLRGCFHLFCLSRIMGRYKIYWILCLFRSKRPWIRYEHSLYLLLFLCIDRYELCCLRRLRASRPSNLAVNCGFCICCHLLCHRLICCCLCGCPGFMILSHFCCWNLFWIIYLSTYLLKNIKY